MEEWRNPPHICTDSLSPLYLKIKKIPPIPTTLGGEMQQRKRGLRGAEVDRRRVKGQTGCDTQR